MCGWLEGVGARASKDGDEAKGEEDDEGERDRVSMIERCSFAAQRFGKVRGTNALSTFTGGAYLALSIKVRSTRSRIQRYLVLGYQHA